jgi:hypothetical protein
MNEKNWREVTKSEASFSARLGIALSSHLRLSAVN